MSPHMMFCAVHRINLKSVNLNSNIPNLVFAGNMGVRRPSWWHFEGTTWQTRKFHQEAQLVSWMSIAWKKRMGCNWENKRLKIKNNQTKCPTLLGPDLDKLQMLLWKTGCALLQSYSTLYRMIGCALSRVTPFYKRTVVPFWVQMLRENNSISCLCKETTIICLAQTMGQTDK
jgi:hypothetical protein